VFLLSPKSCANSWSESGDRDLDLEELTRGLLFMPRAQVLAGVTGASHQSDRCRPLVGFCSIERVGDFLGVLCCYCFVFDSVWSLGSQLLGIWVSNLRPV
jgi:hypothetical protein